MPSQPRPAMASAFVAPFLAAIAALRAVLAQVRPPDDVETTLTAINAWLWLDRVADGVTRLVARIQAGALRPLGSRAALASANPGLGGFGEPLVPRTRGWLARLLPHPEPFIHEIETLLAGPELQPLLAQEPERFARLLRPVCRALGLATPTPLAAAAPAPPASADPPPAPPKSGRRAEWWNGTSCAPIQPPVLARFGEPRPASPALLKIA